MWLLPYIILFLQSCLICWLAIPMIMRLALKWDIVDKPGHRKVHQAAKPLLGGVGIFLSFNLTILFDMWLFGFLAAHDWLPTWLSAWTRVLGFVPKAIPKLLIIMVGGFLMHALGLLDDIYKEKLSYKIKFIAQFCIALGVSFSGISIDIMPHPVLNQLVTALWIVGISNSFNLLDNLDGLTSGVAVIAGLILAGVGILQGQTFFAFTLMALAGASLGFLFHNFHPAKLFMGDSGSLYLGYMFACLTAVGSYVVPTSSSLMAVVLPVLVLSIPLYDTFSVMFIRRREGRPLFLGDKCHFSHRLLDLGMSHRSTVVFIYVVCFCVGITAALLPYLSVWGNVIILLQALAIYGLITILMVVAKNLKNVSH
jgi:UDP-GlcNAc:undecaprenyl-phosphate/decaprenyl-phosphate GlcNAc-1-phosphate transferase